TGALHWRERLATIVETMREMSRQTDPQAMVRTYGARIRKLLPADGSVSLSRRDLSAPQFRVTRFSGWTEVVNPWQERDELPVLKGGLLADLIYSDEPHLIHDLKLRAGDPATPYLEGQRSLMVLPLYDKGVALNMVVVARREPNAFDPDRFPE